MKKNNILKRGIKFIKRMIYSYFDFKNFRKTLNNNKNNIILISHNADGGGGAPVVLYDYAKYLKKCNKNNVIFLSEKPGTLYKNKEIKVFLMEKLYKKYLKEIEKNKNKIKYIVVNTIVCCKYVKKMEEIDIPIIWWIHEEKKILEKNASQFRSININSKINGMCVSDRIEEDLKKIRNDIQYSIMYYGVEDQYNNQFKKRNSQKFVICVIGRICERKNQIQVIEAYNNIKNKKIKNEIEIVFVAGSWNREYRRKLEENIKKNNKIKIIGPLERNEMKRVYENSDLIVCSSIDDPLPVVITEAMMYKKHFITSNATGQAKIIKDGYNGFVYDSNNTQQLTDKILKIYNRDYNKDILNNGRELYKNNFSFNIIEEKIERKIKNV